MNPSEKDDDDKDKDSTGNTPPTGAIQPSTRAERDGLGSLSIDSNSLFGIGTARALALGPLSGTSVHPLLISSYAQVKWASALTNFRLGYLSQKKYHLIEKACCELRDHPNLLPSLDSLLGGAGTSLNLSVNEWIANRALVLGGWAPGSYSLIHPISDINLHQSTNDTYPTALRLGLLRQINDLEKKLNSLIMSTQVKEKEFHSLVKVGRTQLQDAVLTTLGRSFGAFAEALGRDRWRIQKCIERTRVVNLGGTAIGTGIGAPRDYIFKVIESLREVTGQLGLARAENLVDATQNWDDLVEVSGTLKALATNLIKISQDLRLMSSGPQAGFGEIILPGVQTGSSLMPGKMNPVVPESVIQSATLFFGYEMVMGLAASQGNLELNAFAPLMAHSLLGGGDLLIRSVGLLDEKCMRGVEARSEIFTNQVNSGTATATALVEVIGYEKMRDLLKEIESRKKNSGSSEGPGYLLKKLCVERGLISPEDWDRLIGPERVLKLGYLPTQGAAHASSGHRFSGTLSPGDLVESSSTSFPSSIIEGSVSPHPSLPSVLSPHVEPPIEIVLPSSASPLSASKGNRLHIGVFGRRNAGKSSLINAIFRSEVSIVSPEPGTTTDPVEKPMELHPLGPILLIDTAGLDDEGDLGSLRIQKSLQVMDRVDLALLVGEESSWGSPEEKIDLELKKRKIPTIRIFSKADLKQDQGGRESSDGEGGDHKKPLRISALKGQGLTELLEAMVRTASLRPQPPQPSLLSGLVPPGGLILLVTPIDREAPKGRLILPQVQTIREALDGDQMCVVVKEREVAQALVALRRRPDLVVTDSQVFLKVAGDLPPGVPLTSFSILFARLKGDLDLYLKGTLQIEKLKSGDRVLFCEACSHQPVCDDIGRVKIPRWLKQYTGADLECVHIQGSDFPRTPDELRRFQLVVHCGSCMQNRQSVVSRLMKCDQAGVPVTNYGLTIAYVQGIFHRCLEGLRIHFPSH